MTITHDHNVRTPTPVEITLTAHAILPATMRAPSHARRILAAILAAWNIDADTSDTALVLTSEVTTNAARAAAGEPITLSVTGEPERIRIAVSDPDGSSADLPARALPDAAAVEDPSSSVGLSGFGLPMLDLMAADHGVDKTGDGKSVWFELAAGGVS